MEFAFARLSLLLLLPSSYVHADLTIDVARCRDGECVACVLKPENVALDGLLHGMIPFLVPEVFPPVGFSMQAQMCLRDTQHHPYISACFCGIRSYGDCATKKILTVLIFILAEYL